MFPDPHATIAKGSLVSTSRLVSRLRRTLRRDEGIGLVEVIVALMIFSIITLGMSFSLVTMTRIAFESKNREVAANLAAAEIDRLHSAGDAFKIHSTVEPVAATVVDGINYYVRSTVA